MGKAEAGVCKGSHGNGTSVEGVSLRGQNDTSPANI